MNWIETRSKPTIAEIIANTTCGIFFLLCTGLIFWMQLNRVYKWEVLDYDQQDALGVIALLLFVLASGTLSLAVHLRFERQDR